jgi:N-acetylmuramoyl-L-alanine amidase
MKRTVTSNRLPHSQSRLLMHRWAITLLAGVTCLVTSTAHASVGSPRDAAPVTTQELAAASARVKSISGAPTSSGDQPATALAIDAAEKALARINAEARGWNLINRLQKNAVTPWRDVALVDLSVKHNKITINLSESVTDRGVGSLDFEHALEHIHFQINETIGNDLAVALNGITYETLIDGAPLSTFFPDTLANAAAAKKSQRKIGLSGRRVTISPGHGYYRNDAGAYVLQRSFLQGIVEDFVNAEMVMYLNTNLLSSGVLVRPTRNLDKSAGNGITGFPKWQESAREHIRALGVPAFVWDSSTSDINDDIRARPLYANWIDNNGFATDLIVSLHNNGGGGTGTETLYDTANGFGTESKKLADIVHAKVISTIRSRYNSAWVDRGVKGFAGDYGENRLATRPAILVEVAFMDRATPDNAALQDETFKRLVADAISQALADYYATITDSAAPTVPQSVVTRAFSDKGVQVSWAPSSDDYDAPTYRISRNGVVIGESTTTAFIDNTVMSGATYSYTVVAFDRSNNVSAPSAPANVTVPAPLAAVALSKRGGIDLDGNGKGAILVRSLSLDTVPNKLLAGRLVNDQLVFTPIFDPGPDFRLVGTTDYDANGKSDLVMQNTSVPGEFGEVRAWNDFLQSNDRRIRDVKRVWDVQAVGDLDGDGVGDLVWRYVVSESPDTGVSYIWFSNGATPSETPFVRKRGGAPLTWQLMGAQDLNGDGAADMLYISPSTATTPSSVRILMATANRTCANLSAGTLPLGSKALKYADFTGARRGDLLIRNETTGTTNLISLNAVGIPLPVYTGDPNDRNASCTSSSQIVDAVSSSLPNVDPTWTYYGADDLNGDGIVDIVWLRPDNTLTVWLMAQRPAMPTVINNAGTAPSGYRVFQP